LAGVAILYAILLFFAALVFWSPGFLFTWVFDGIFQLARYPLGYVPRLAAPGAHLGDPGRADHHHPGEALNGVLSSAMLFGSVALAAALVLVSSYLFRFALRRYSSASS
jgi:ABC-2 type transport system permease protein